MLNVLGVIIAFIVIIFLIRRKFNFGLSLIIGSLIVGIFSIQAVNDFFKEIGGRGISATVSIDIDYEEDLKLIDVEQNAIKKAKDFLANAVSTF